MANLLDEVMVRVQRRLGAAALAELGPAAAAADNTSAARPLTNVRLLPLAWQLFVQPNLSRERLPSPWRFVASALT
jgi:hypothetical protein